jgi:hypothetical protein
MVKLRTARTRDSDEDEGEYPGHGDQSPFRSR